MNDLENEETGVIQNLSINSYFGYGINVTEVLYDGPREYLIRCPNTREDIPPLDLLIATLSQELHADETMQKRINTKRELRHEGNRVFVLEFERTDRSDREARYTSKLFGIEVVGELLGATDWCFSVLSSKEEGGGRHTLAEKILNAQPNYWQRRLTEIKVDVPVKGYYHLIDDEQMFIFDAEKITRDALQCIPGLQLKAVERGAMYKSFTSEENPGVQVGTARDLPVYLRLTPKQTGVGRNEQIERRRALAVLPHDHLILRNSSMRADFFVRSVADPHRNDKSPKNVYYSKELALMQQVAQELYVGIWLWRQQGVQRS